MGRCAYDFVDFLAAAGQKYWQLLPIGPTSYGDSPYQSFSSFAGNPYFIDSDALYNRGLITSAQREEARRPVGEIDYGELYQTRYPLLKSAFLRAREKGETQWDFLDAQHMWLHDYALFMACKTYFKGIAWTAWPEDIRLRYHNAMAYYRDILREDVEFHIFLQKEFYAQWFALRAYAAKKGVRIIGDLPIYVPMDSTDVWAAPELFQLDEKGVPKGVAGVPPDYFNADGQLWGNPLYDWARMRNDGYAWWMRRMGACAKLFDMTRIDHFRGLAAYWAVPYGDKTARGGAWIEGPGMDFVEALHKSLPDYPIIAEDLGFLTDDVRRLLSASGYPGMKVLQFAFDSREPSDYLPHTYPRNCVCYTGTHDNTTLRAWFREAKAEDAAYAKAYLGLNREEGYCKGMIRGGMGSVADLFVACMQDYLETGADTRINLPGTVGANWRYRMQPGDCDTALAKSIAQMVRMYGR